MKNILIIIFLILILSVNARSQTITWQRTYGDPNRLEEGNSIVQLPDDGYIAFGKENNPGTQMLAIRLDKFGNIIWRKNYDGAFASEIIKSNDGNYFLAGAKLIKININGDTLWTRQVIGSKIKFTNDGGFYICAGKSLNTNIVVPYLRRFDSLGNLLWDRTYEDSISRGSFYDMLINEDDYLILIGNYSIFDIPFIMKTDSLGNPVWLHGYAIDSLHYQYITQIQFKIEWRILCYRK